MTYKGILLNKVCEKGETMKKRIEKTAITLLLAVLIFAGTVTINSITAEAYSPSSTTCMHISVREYWSGPDYWLPITYFRDYCPLCGTEFGRGSMPGGYINPYPSDPGIPPIKYQP
ncbi:hypothetical protein EHE19_010490 [Ruminiclostridium herbifermentans]|uniref:Uncharacterized protein n=2 Tax=Ruminiclostridium herbifermentans TaxID=2488810 RepID=A0A7H1VJ06_9FIRM|nr:hypothetical protein EHE19_010490 [Ruminiclostridium herbifermentans]